MYVCVHVRVRVCVTLTGVDGPPLQSLVAPRGDAGCDDNVEVLRVPLHVSLDKEEGALDAAGLVASTIHAQSKREQVSNAEGLNVAKKARDEGGTHGRKPGQDTHTRNTNGIQSNDRNKCK